ncbi:hypothetical protein ACQHIV_15080 [Kribbella sp. GL6]
MESASAGSEVRQLEQSDGFVMLLSMVVSGRTAIPVAGQRPVGG